jgi:hypothetical protein
VCLAALPDPSGHLETYKNHGDQKYHGDLQFSSGLHGQYAYG